MGEGLRGSTAVAERDPEALTLANPALDKPAALNSVDIDDAMPAELRRCIEALREGKGCASFWHKAFGARH